MSGLQQSDLLKLPNLLTCLTACFADAGVLRRVGECHQIVGGVLLQGRTLRLASGRREKQDPGRSQHRRRLPLDLYVMLSSIVLPLNAEKNKNCIPVLLPTTKHSMQYHRSIVLR